ncbi:591_t:CDS:1, partial [Racocetra persica]
HVQKTNEPPKIEAIEDALFGISKNEIYNPIVTAEEVLDDLIASSLSRPGNKRIKRPLNKFMVFKKNFKKVITTSTRVMTTSTSKNTPNKYRMREITRAASRFWNDATSFEKEPFEKIANHVKKLHKKKFPTYSYTPTMKKPQDPFINLTGTSSNIGLVPLEPVENSSKDDVKQPVEEQRPSIVSVVPQQESNLIDSDYLFDGRFFEEPVSLVGNEVTNDAENAQPYHIYNSINDLYSESNNDTMLSYHYFINNIEFDSLFNFDAASGASG